MIGAIIAAIVLSTVLGSALYGRTRQRAKSVEEWALGGRRMGTLVFWFLNAGEIYTTFAVLGISGFAWAYGAPAYLAFTSVSLSAAAGYWLTPRIHAYGTRHGLVTQADFFAHRYGSRALGVLVALAGVVALVVYVQIQITALTLVVQLAIGPVLGKAAAGTLATAAMVLFVFLAGLRSAAFAAGVKDVLMLALVAVLAWTAAQAAGFSSAFDLFAAVDRQFPTAMRFPGLQPQAGMDLVWLASSAVNVALGTYVFPHMFQLCFAASDGDTIRRNAVFQPIYSLSYIFIILLGLAALMAHTNPPGHDPNALLIAFVGDHYPAWIMGVFAGTAALLALVPGSVLLLTSGSILARNVVRPCVPGLSAGGELAASRLAMVVMAGAALWLALGANASLVEIGLSAYAAIGMLAPGVFFGLGWRRTHAWAVAGGIVVGFITLWLPAAQPWVSANFPHWEPGLVALLLNGATCAILTMAIPAPKRANVAPTATNLASNAH